MVLRICINTICIHHLSIFVDRKKTDLWVKLFPENVKGQRLLKQILNLKLEGTGSNYTEHPARLAIKNEQKNEKY